MKRIHRIKRAHELARSFWVKACAAQGIDNKAMFVLFDDSNVYAQAHNRAVGIFIGAGAYGTR